MKKYLFLFCSLLIGIVAYSQNMSVSSFRYLENNITALEANVTDVNGELCALIIVNTPVQGLKFGGCNIEKTEQKTGAVWVFVSPGVQFITIMHSDLGQLRDYPFPQSIESGKTYEMVLKTAKITQIIEETITEQYLIIESKTPDAKIYINNEYAGRNSAMKFLSIFEEHTYRIEAPLYHTKEGKLRLNAEQKTTLKIDLDPAFGYLKVNTTPVEGAEIEINGKLQEGKTPFVSQELESGLYTVQAFMPMYTSEALEVSVMDGKTTEINIPLVSTVSTVEIDCEDKEVEIYIDGSYRCKGTFLGILGEGMHRLELKKDRHRTLRKNFIVIPSQPYKETLPALEAITGKLNLNSTPYGAKIFIDDKVYGETPLVIPKILIGKHQVRLEKSGYHDLTQQINIEEGKIAKYDLLLEAKEDLTQLIEAEKHIIEKIQSAPSEERGQKEVKIKPRTDWKFAFSGGYKIDNGAKNRYRGEGVNFGMKLSCKPRGLWGFGFYVSTDMIYSTPNNHAKRDYQQMAEEFIANNSYEYYKITLPHYYDFDFIIGLNYDLKLGKQFKIFAEVGAGLQLGKASNEKHEYCIGEESSKKIITHPFESDVVFQGGLGVEFFNMLRFAYYPNLIKLELLIDL